MTRCTFLHNYYIHCYIHCYIQCYIQCTYYIKYIYTEHTVKTVNTCTCMYLFLNAIFSDMSKRCPWSLEEKTACSHHYKKFIAMGSLPGKKQIVDVQQTVPCLQERKDHGSKSSIILLKKTMQ